MKRLVVLAAIALASPAWAGFDAGVEAYKAGDYGAAMREWRPLAERGDGRAQHNLGILFNYGQGVPQNLAEAAKWYLRAAEQGNGNAQVKLGWLLATGRGVAQDSVEAVRWFRESAETGLAEGQYNIAIMYQTGMGIEADRVQALMWLMLAAGGGLAPARERRDLLAAEMTPAEVDEAELLASVLSPVKSARPTPPVTAQDSVAPTAAQGITVHLASYRSRKAATRGWAILRKAHSDVLGGLEPRITRLDQGKRGVFFRLQAGPVASKAKAEQLCIQLKSRDLFCAPVF